LKKGNSGQTRILEAVVASIIIFILFSVAAFMIRSSDVVHVQERGDLDRLGYNVLSSVVESGTIEKTLESSDFSEFELKTFIQRMLPSSTFFNVTIFNYTQTGDFIEKDSLVSRVGNVEDVEIGSFSDFLEVSSTPTIYTSKKGNIYSIILLLARAGGG